MKFFMCEFGALQTIPNIHMFSVEPEIISINTDPPLRAVPMVWNGTYISCLLSGRSHVSHGDSEEPPSVRLVWNHVNGLKQMDFALHDISLMFEF